MVVVFFVWSLSANAPQPGDRPKRTALARKVPIEESANCIKKRPPLGNPIAASPSSVGPVPTDEIATAIARCAGCFLIVLRLGRSIDSREGRAIHYGAAAKSSSTAFRMSYDASGWW